MPAKLITTITKIKTVPNPTWPEGAVGLAKNLGAGSSEGTVSGVVCPPPPPLLLAPLTTSPFGCGRSILGNCHLTKYGVVVIIPL
jgi:hypothetical protein